MLALPFAKGDKKFDVLPLSSFFALHYNNSPYKTDLVKFESLKNSIIHLDNTDDTAITNHLYYYSELSSLYTRIKSYSEINFNFTYYDPLSIKSTKLTSSSLLFEVATTLYNLAALFSLRGSSNDRQTDEGLKVSSKFFQLALSCIEKLEEYDITNGFPIHSLNFSQSTTNNLTCFTREGLNFIKTLLQAQIQACVYEKASRDYKKKNSSMKSSVVSKIATQTYTFYQLLHKCIYAGIMNSVLDNSWSNICELQLKLYQGLSEYWHGVASFEAATVKGSGYGESVTRAKTALRLLGEAQGLTRSNQALAPYIKTSIEMVEEFYKQKHYDINHIYMEAPPDESTLRLGEGVSMIRSIAFPSPPFSTSNLDQNFTSTFTSSLFLFIMPKDLIDEITQYSRTIPQMFESYSRRNEEMTNLCKTTLASQSLPESVEAVKFAQLVVKNKGEGEESLLLNFEKNIPQWKEILELRASSYDSSGLYSYLVGQLEDLEISSQRALNSMANIESSIQREERIDEEFHKRYPFYYNIASSDKTKDHFSNLNLLREKFNQAINNDRKIREVLLENPSSQKYFNFLSLGSFQEYLKYFIVDSSLLISSDSLSFTEVDLLENKLNILTQNLKDREKSVEELKLLAQYDGFSELNNNPSLVTNISSALREKNIKANELREKIEHKIFEQENLLQEIEILNKEFLIKREDNIIIKHFNNIISNFNEYITKLKQVQTQLSAGFTFYAGLQMKLTTLQQNVDDLILQQQNKRHEYELTINNPKINTNLSRSNSLAYTSSSSNPPLLPSSALPSRSVSVNPNYNPSYNPSFDPNFNSTYGTPSSSPLGPSSQSLPPKPTYGIVSQGPPSTSTSYVPPQSTPSYSSPQSNPPYGIVSHIPPAPTPQYSYSNYGPPPTPASSVPMPDPVTMEQMTRTLMDMGFERNKVVEALLKSDWRTDEALNMLLAANNNNPENYNYTKDANCPDKKKKMFSLFGKSKSTR